MGGRRQRIPGVYARQCWASPRCCSAVPLEVWVILGGVFLVDATLTLISRIARGDRWFEAHRVHAYQILASRWRAHLPVTALVIAVNALWLFPWAWVAAAVSRARHICVPWRRWSTLCRTRDSPAMGAGRPSMTSREGRCAYLRRSSKLPRKRCLRTTTELLAQELAAPTSEPPRWSEFEWRIACAVAAMQGVSPLLHGHGCAAPGARKAGSIYGFISAAGSGVHRAASRG